MKKLSLQNQSKARTKIKESENRKLVTTSFGSSKGKEG